LYFSCKNYQELAQARITKVVEFFTTNPTKLSLPFSVFSTIFYAFYKNQLNGFTIGDSLLHRGPWKVLDSYKYALGSRKTPRELWIPCNVVLGGGGRCGRWNSGEVRRRGRPGTGEGWPRGAPGSVSALGWGSGNAGGVARRRPRRAAELPAPARCVAMRSNWRLG
jgi:hypothetical protein